MSSPTQDSGGIDRVHIVWMNHLDVGFTNNIASVLNIYFHEYFTKAIETAKEVNTPGEPPVFRYTSHAWLLDIFFNCPRFLGLECPVDSSVGDINLGMTPDYDAACVVCPSASLVEAVEKVRKTSTSSQRGVLESAWLESRPIAVVGGPRRPAVLWLQYL